MLLVDDDEPEVPEPDILLQQLVGADDDVETAFGERLQRLRCFLCGTEARQLRELHRPLREAIGEVVEVLLS